jgi:thiamine biosynthesis lipoprotein
MPLRLACQAMGTRFELVLAGQREDQLRAVGELALEEIQIAHRRWNAFASDSMVAHLTRCAGGPGVKVDPETFELLHLCVEVAKKSHGFFNPLLGPLLRQLGMRDDIPEETTTPLTTLIDVKGIRLDPDSCSVGLAMAGMELDLGAIAKGQALDLAARVLIEEGVTCALMHGGTSTALALDPPPGKDAWQVVIGTGEHAPQALLANTALSVSAAHSRHGSPIESGNATGQEQQGLDPTEHHPRDHHSHILDPHQACGTRHLLAAAVVGPSAAACDAWSTALVAGCRPTDVPANYSLLTQPSPDSWLLSPGRPTCFHIEPCTPATPPPTAAPF